MYITRAFRLIIATALLWGVSIPAESMAQVSMGVSGGVNLCLPNGAADCEDIYPLGYINGSFEYRFLTYVAVGLDYNLSGLATRQADASIAAHHAVFMLRGHLPFSMGSQDTRMALGLGSGYGELWGSHSDIEDPFYTFFSPFATLRVDAALLLETPWALEWGPELIWVGYFHGERCFVHPLGQSDCAATADLSGPEADVIDLLQMGVTARYVF